MYKLKVCLYFWLVLASHSEVWLWLEPWYEVSVCKKTLAHYYSCPHMCGLAVFSLLCSSQSYSAGIGFHRSQNSYHTLGQPSWTLPHVRRACYSVQSGTVAVMFGDKISSMNYSANINQVIQVLEKILDIFEFYTIIWSLNVFLKVCENQDNPFCESADLGPELFHSPNLQFLVLNGSTLLSVYQVTPYRVMSPQKKTLT